MPMSRRTSIRVRAADHISVEPFHLFRYVGEQAFRFNSRKFSDGTRFAEALGNVTGRRIMYKHLTGKDEPQLRLF